MLKAPTAQALRDELAATERDARQDPAVWNSRVSRGNGPPQTSAARWPRSARFKYRPRRPGTNSFSRYVQRIARQRVRVASCRPRDECPPEVAMGGRERVSRTNWRSRSAVAVVAAVAITA